jgi:hypothetical protein
MLGESLFSASRLASEFVVAVGLLIWGCARSRAAWLTPLRP